MFPRVPDKAGIVVRLVLLALARFILVNAYLSEFKLFLIMHIEITDAILGMKCGYMVKAISDCIDVRADLALYLTQKTTKVKDGRTMIENLRVNWNQQYSSFYVDMIPYERQRERGSRE